MKMSGLAPSLTAPTASSGSENAPILQTSTISSAASSAGSISEATATPPSGNAKTTGCLSLRSANLVAKWRRQPDDLLLTSVKTPKESSFPKPRKTAIVDHSAPTALR